MDQFTREHLKELAEALVEPAVSVYMPTFRSGREVRQNAIRFKNLVKQAFVQLSERGMDDEEARHLLAEASSLEANDDWWQHQSDGLAMFLAPERFDCYRVPLVLKSWSPSESGFTCGRWSGCSRVMAAFTYWRLAKTAYGYSKVRISVYPSLSRMVCRPTCGPP
jgi:hypothetical protein